MASFGNFKLDDGLIRYAMQNLILTALWKLLKMGKTGVQETIYETTKEDDSNDDGEEGWIYWQLNR